MTMLYKSFAKLVASFSLVMKLNKLSISDKNMHEILVI